MRTLTAFLLSFLVAAPAAAQRLGPDELVRKVTEDVLAAIQSDKQLQAGDKQKSLALAEEKVLPHIDFREAVTLAMGRSWHQATPEQKDKLVREFRSMLVRIYANAIDRYRGQTMRVLPVRMQPNANEATVRNQYLSPGRPPVPVEYSMRMTTEGWKIYDISVEGVSLVLTYRAEFENIIRASGVEGLIKRLQEKRA
jgi:phospholipid transport system substrate-binding protein